MIRVAGNIITTNMFMGQFQTDSIQMKIVTILSSSPVIYDYNSINQLNFELNLRTNIVDSARNLNNSDLAFTTFRGSYCNQEFWTRTSEGGFLVKNNVTSYDAIQDIFKNSREYGTECSTAIVIIFYKALTEILPENLFNNLFANIYLMNWSNLDRDLDLADYRNLSDYLPGDCRYFKNPDVNPLTPHWQGENTIELGDGLYYGHGIGIATGEDIIQSLNSNRRAGAEQSAYLLDSALRPNFRYLYSRYASYTANYPMYG